MSPHAYTEDQLVEQPAIGLFASLGWQTISALEETFGTAGTLGRETKSEVVLVERLRIALTKLNPGLPPEAIQTAIDELARDRSAMSLVAANREVYKVLKEGASEPAQRGRQPLHLPTRSGREFHFVFRTQSWVSKNSRTEPSIPRRQQRHRFDARGPQARPRSRRSVLANAREWLKS